jgi:ceramide glucosyltransferase
MQAILAAFAAGVAALGLIQSVAGLVAVRRFVARRPMHAEAGAWPPVTILKPLHGDEPLLEEALASLCEQDYPRYQVVLGVRAAADGAVPIVGQLQAKFPNCDIALVIDPALHGHNGKVSNLINMLSSAKHDVLVIADSDVHAAPDYLRRLLATLQAPGVGLVTTLYTGLPVLRPPSLVQTLGMLGINQYFLPGAVLARMTGRQDCLGATMALRRETLVRIGGLEALVDHLADDNWLGRLVRGLGLKVALADTIPATTVPETHLAALWRHELRWARTIRTLVPLPFAASVLQYPIAWAALACLLAEGDGWALAWVASCWAVRGVTAWAIDRPLGLAFRSPVWLLPVRELMSIAVMAASYAGREVEWRGHRMIAEGR